MKKNNNRRSFLKRLTLSGLGFSVMPGGFLHEVKVKSSPDHREDPREGKITGPKHVYNGAYSEDWLSRVAFPLGGIGAGMFCLEGTGAISHLSVRNHPDVFNEPAMFAAIAVKGSPESAKLLEGPVPGWKKFGQPLSGLGSAGTTWGLPRFEQAEFLARIPFGEISLKDKQFDLDVHLTGWSPFIPTDADHSSMPVAALEYQFRNTGTHIIDYIFSYNSRNIISLPDTPDSIKSCKNGFILSQSGTGDAPEKQADFAIFTDDDQTKVDHCWFRGGWWDPLTMAWNTIQRGEMKENPPIETGAPGASLFVPFNLGPGEEKKIVLMMAWYVPHTKLRIGDEPTAKTDQTVPDTSSSLPSPYHMPWYSSRFKTINEVIEYWQLNYTDLRQKSAAFRDAFYLNTLPPEVTEAVAANICILKSPTVMRQYDGRLWCWEGCQDDEGSCYGSCTHVWNYAQALPHLFPSLERSLRDTEFGESQNAEGHQNFRTALPIRSAAHNFYAAADGQLGGIMKVYRDWRISGDSRWLRKIYPKVKSSLDYCINTWDPGNKGILVEPHHNTYDIEFWGPDGMCNSFYLGALSAISIMGKYLNEDVSGYEDLYAQGKKYVENVLFNGKYFIQQIQYTGLNAPDPVKASEKSYGGDYSEEARKLLQQEGPKYQYGHGCLSDGVLGAWIASMAGLDSPIDEQKTKDHLMMVHLNNFKKDLSAHSNPQRPTYALGREGGLLLCTWPQGGKLSLPFVYCDEVWTGIEYQVASHLIGLGQMEEGLEIVRSCRDRYDGRVRNPFDEYECGHWYARAMSSYGLIQAITGLRYDAEDKALFIDSKTGDFTSFLSTETGFGTVSLLQGKPIIKVAYGNIPVEKIYISGKEV